MMDRNAKITGLDYGYIDHVVRTLRISAEVQDKPTLPYEQGPLLSIHLQSNRPDNFTTYMENLVASLDDPTRIEVVLKIDDTDEAMNQLLPALIEKYKGIITIKFISTPLVGGFFELWRSMNDMLKVCHPHAYFLWNMNDEMAVLNKGWDTALAKYVALFPDHLFRLRTSVFRSRNYYDYWECGFAPETSAITTKRWLDICGDWNPCLGPDSFNQCVAFYFGYHDRFYKHRVDRDIPIHDFIFAGEGAYIGMSEEALYRRTRGASKAWFRLMSYQVQSEASRRSQRIMAHIWAHRELKEFKITEDTNRQCFDVYDAIEDKIAYRFPYKLSKIRVKLTNCYRASAYHFFAGGGNYGTPYTRMKMITGFLALRYDFVNNTRTLWLKCRPSIQAATRKVKSELFAAILKIRSLPVEWNIVQAFRQKRLSLGQLILAVPKRVTRMATAKVMNRGIRFHHTVFVFDDVEKKIDWTSLHTVLRQVKWPEYFASVRIQGSLLKCMLLQHWYELDPAQLVEMIGRDLSFQRFVGIPLNAPIPAASLMREFNVLLEESGVMETIIRRVDVNILHENLPYITLYKNSVKPIRQVSVAI